MGCFYSLFSFKIFWILLGIVFLVSWGLLGHFVTYTLNCNLRRYINKDRSKLRKLEEFPAKLTPALGCIERLIYTLLFVLGKYELIAGLFALFVAHRIVLISQIKDYCVVKDVGERLNIYLITNIFSLVVGIIGGWIIIFFKP